MRRDVIKLAGAREVVIPDPTLSYLRTASPHLAEHFVDVLDNRTHLSLPARDGQMGPNYIGFLRVMHHHAEETKAPLGGRNFLIAPNLPVPNVLTTVYDQLAVPTWRRRHARALGSTSLSAMQLMIDFDGGGRKDTVSLGYLRQGAETNTPDARLTFFDNSNAVLLEGYGSLKGVTDIGAAPQMRDALISDVTFAAQHILGLDKA